MDELEKIGYKKAEPDERDAEWEVYYEQNQGICTTNISIDYKYGYIGVATDWVNKGYIEKPEIIALYKMVSGKLCGTCIYSIADTEIQNVKRCAMVSRYVDDKVDFCSWHCEIGTYEEVRG